MTRRKERREERHEKERERVARTDYFLLPRLPLPVLALRLGLAPLEQQADQRGRLKMRMRMKKRDKTTRRIRKMTRMYVMTKMKRIQMGREKKRKKMKTKMKKKMEIRESCLACLAFDLIVCLSPTHFPPLLVLHRLLLPCPCRSVHLVRVCLTNTMTYPFLAAAAAERNEVSQGDCCEVRVLLL